MMLTREQAFEQLIARGADRAVVQFSGGNDEGGPDHIRLFAGERELPELAVYVSARNPSAAEQAEETLSDVLSRPIYERYGTFAGDFEVAGELTWDVQQRTVLMNREEREEWAHSEEFV